MSSLDKATYVEWEESETLMKKPWSGHSSDPVMAGTILMTCNKTERYSPRILTLELMLWRSLMSTPGVRDAIVWIRGIEGEKKMEMCSGEELN